MQYLINPEIAAHNIAATYCAHEVNKLDEKCFNAGDKESCESAVKIWNLYSNIYDSVFEVATKDNVLSIQEE